jgi:hypothetical protein
MLFSLLYEILHPKYSNVKYLRFHFALSITILILTGLWPLNAVTIDCDGDIFIPNVFRNIVQRTQ